MKVSVCMATYNGAEYINEQIYSILKQLSYQDELIISDDGSTDNTIDIIKNIHDNRISLFKNCKKKGVAHHFENALSHATGEYIFLADQDDIWIDNKLSVIIKELENVDCVLHNATLIDKDGNLLGDDLFSIYKTRPGYFKNLFRNTYVGCCMAIRKELLKYILPIPDKISMHDMWIALIAEKKGTTKILPDKLIQYRRHGNNASTTSKKSNFSFYFQLKYRLAMFYNTLIRN